MAGLASALVVCCQTLAYGQVIGTQCWNANGVLQCNQQAGVLYSPPTVFDQLGSYYQSLAQELARQRAMRAMQQQNEAAQAQAAAAEEQAATEANARQAAAQRLYVERVESVVQELSDSLRLFGQGAKWLVEAITPSILDLYKVNPEASRQVILEVLQPHLSALNRRFQEFLYRVVPAAKPAVDSLALKPEEAQLFAQALLPITQDVFMANLEATPSEYRAAIQPFLARARFYFDSTRVARTDSLKASGNQK